MENKEKRDILNDFLNFIENNCYFNGRKITVYQKSIPNGFMSVVDYYLSNIFYKIKGD